MRFTSSTCLLFVLVTLLAASSFVSSLSIRRAILPEHGVQLVKRAPKVVTSVTSKPPVDKTSAPATHASTTSRANATSTATNASASAGADSTDSSFLPSSVPPTAGANISSTASQNMSTTMSNATETNTAAPPPAGLSTPLIAAFGGIAGAIVVGGLAFLFMRQKHKSNTTQNVASKGASQFPTNNPYTSPPYNATSNTGYERLSDPSLPIPNNASTPSVGTFTVVSTYTPTLGDELEIQPGDKVTILVEYDDGWCQGVNESRGRVKGVFPKHCVDMGNSQEDQVRGKRVSSMYGTGYRM